MKRILTLVWLTAFLVCCDFGPRQTSAENNEKNFTEIIGWAKKVVHEDDDIEYHIYISGSSDGGITVVNHTKELLEIELIQKQIDEIDKRNQE